MNTQETTLQPLNILHSHEGLLRTQRILACAQQCTRTIVEYDDAQATRHRRGLPLEVIQRALMLPYIEFVAVPCDRHGGITYQSSSLVADVL